MAEKLTKLTHKIAVQLHLVAQRCSRSRRPVRKFWIHPCIGQGEGLVQFGA